MGEAKQRRDAIARGEPDPGPSAPTPWSPSRSPVLHTKPGENQEERAKMWDGLRTRQRELRAQRDMAKNPYTSTGRR
jgi:hypothetical protein